jgi:hypothetical protein
MALISSGRARVAAAVLLCLCTGLLIPTATAFAATVSVAGGGNAISADEFGTSRYTTLTGPAVNEASTGELTLHSTTILNVPAGFRFNPGVGRSAWTRSSAISGAPSR